MSDKPYSTPDTNELIPSDDRPTIEPPELSPEYEKRHRPEPPELSPDYEELHRPGPPELSPGYVEPQPRPERTPAVVLDALENALAKTTVDPIRFADGLQLRRGEGGGLDVWKDNPNRHIRDIASLEPDELRTVKTYLDDSR